MFMNSRVAILSNSDSDMTDQFICSVQVILGVFEEKSIELESESIPMNNLIGKILLHVRNCPVTPCGLQE